MKDYIEECQTIVNLFLPSRNTPSGQSPQQSLRDLKPPPPREVRQLPGTILKNYQNQEK